MLRIFVEIVGWVGALLIIGAYLLVSMGRVTARTPLYQWMNFVGAVGFIVNSGWNGAYPSVFLNVVWLFIALYALTQQRAAATGPPQA
jgi:formate hydrogenlyase subunit 3/multisubunit Na+/H+ antiporter MnhD subunit